MAIIALEGMRFFAYHGLYEEERILGTHFILDINLETDISEAKTVVEDGIDKITDTINYETVYEICALQMQKKNAQLLLETVLENIVHALKAQFQTISIIKIKIKKLNPPLSGQVDWSSVENTENYHHKCGRCEEDMICYLDENCWCMKEKEKIHPRTTEMLATQYKGCLCAKCLKEFVG